MPREEEMLPKDKYTIFDRKEKKYRKGIHSEFLFPAKLCDSLRIFWVPIEPSAKTESRRERRRIRKKKVTY